MAAKWFLTIPEELTLKVVTTTYYIAQELLSVTCQPRWAWASGENGYLYVYGRVPLLST